VLYEGFCIVKGVLLDTDNGVDGVRTMFDDCGVLVIQVDKLHRAAIETAAASEGRNAQLQHEFDEKF